MDTNTFQKLKQLDRDAYILKNKIMAAFDREFATNLTAKDADDLHFIDILTAPKRQETEKVYALLKKVANHGVTLEQKHFLYDYAHVFFANESGSDFDDHFELMKETPQLAPLIAKGHNCAALFKHGAFRGACLYHWQPIGIIEFIREVPDDVDLAEALLVQNGCAMIVRTVYALENVSDVRQILEHMAAHFEGQDDDDF